MTFAAPLWLWALLAVPLLALVEAWASGRDRERASRLVAVSLWPRVVVRPPSWSRGVRLSLLLLGAVGVVVALARPQWGIVREKVEREGVDVVLALDTSGSMATEDVPPNRFFLAKAALLSLVARLEGDRFGLLAFEGEAYPLVPLTLDADAVGLFLETLDPGAVPAPGSSLGVGLSKGLDMFVDKGRQNKVLVLISDGEDLEGEVEPAVKKAKEAGVIVHTVGVGTEAGQPVPDFDREGKQVGFKKDEAGSAVVSRLHPETLEAMARGTGGRFFRIGGVETSLTALASVIEGMEQKTVAREFTYRKKERYQAPLAVGLVSLGLALILPFPDLRRKRDFASGTSKTPRAPRGAAAVLLAVLATPSARAAEGGKPVDEVLLRPQRLTNAGRQAYDRGDHPASLQAFERASAARPADPQTRFNLADALYKNGKYDEAAALYGALGQDAASPLAAAARYNLGNALFQKKDYPAAVRAYREALQAAPGDADTRRNLEAALRALQQQQKERQRQQDKKDDQKDQDKNQKKDDQQQGSDKDSKKQDQKQSEKKDDKSQGKDGSKPEPEKTPEQKENERFQKEAGMPKDRAMQLLDALQQNEKGEQKKILAAQRKKKKGGKDW